jgi:tRNA pseudouridine38-40 synthase
MESSQRFFLHFAYNGKNFCGWQIQKNGTSVQSTINHSISTLLQLDVNLVGCGRTDAGVHAECFYAHFDLEKTNKITDKNIFVKKLNGFLPDDIVVFNLFPVTIDANARYSAISRTYEYRIARQKNPFYSDFRYELLCDLDFQLMNRASETLLEYSDFTSFAKLHSQSKTNICHIVEALWYNQGNTLVFKITADRFLRNMVRAIVGTLLDVGRKKNTTEDFRKIIECKNHSLSGTSVPAKGLFLVDVRYPEQIFLG